MTPRDLAQLPELISQAMRADRHRLHRRLRAIQQSAQSGRPYDRSLDKWQRELDSSIQYRAQQYRMQDYGRAEMRMNDG